MIDGKNKKIGLFEYDWSMYGFIKDFVIKLAEAGYLVDVFQKKPHINVDFANAEQLNQYKNVRYFSFNVSNTLPRKIERKLIGLLRRINLDIFRSPNKIIDYGILQNSKSIIDSSNYYCFIGIEKKGLIWAGLLSQVYKCPLIYYSLELYLEDHPRLSEALATKEFSYLRRMEKKYHQLCCATIIQDKHRAEALLKYNEIGSTNLMFLPISTRGDIVKKKSNYFHQKYGINEAIKLIIYYGMIQDARYSTEIVRIAPELQDDVMLVLHGFGDSAYLEYLQSKADMGKVIFSLELVAEDKILDVISATKVGLALYENTNSNDRLAAFSSVKVAYYLQCGVPIIAFGSESFRELMITYKCGELITSIDEIPLKVEKILMNYDSYQEQAFAAYRNYYDFDKNFTKFILDFDHFVDNRCMIKS